MSKLSATALVLAALTAAPAARALPVPGYIYPSSLQAGTSARVIVGGMYMRSVCGGVVSGGGVKVSRVTQVPSFPRASGKTQVKWAKEWFYDILAGDSSDRELPPEAVSADTDWPKCDWWEHLNKHDDLELQIICRFWFTPENYPQPTPALDQLVILDIDVDANAKPGCRELFVYDGTSMSAPHPFFITKESHVLEPFLVVPTKEQSKLGRPAVLHLPCNLPVQRPPVALDGQVWPGETDEFKLELKGGTRYTFEMVARELLPYLGDAVPGFFNPVMKLFDPEGREIAFADDFFFLPDPILSCVVPVDGVYTLRLHDNLYRGRQDFVYTVRCYADSPYGHSYKPQERAFVCYPPPAAHQPPAPSEDSKVMTGVIDCPGRVIRHDFHVDEPVTMGFELFARRMGSPLDGRVCLYGPINSSTPVGAAPLLAEWDDVDKFLAGSIPQAICDPVGSWTFLEPGDYRVTVTDQYGLGGADYSYSLCLTKLLPDFEVYAKSSALLLRGNEASVEIVVVPRNGFTGEVTIEGNDDFDCDCTVGEKSEDKTVTFVPKKRDWKGLKTAQFFASATVGPDKKRIVRRVTPADSTEQAFAYTHLLPARSFFFYRPE